MDSLMQLFYDEANEMVEGMEQVLLALESGEPDPETVNALFRYAHSFKGNSAAMGFTHLSKFTHGLESAMESLRKEQRPLTPELATLMLQAVDLIRALLERTRTEGDVGDPACDALLQQINAALNGVEASTVGQAPSGAPSPLSAGATSSVETPAQSEVPPATVPDTATESDTPQYRIFYQPAPTLSAEHDPLQLLEELQEYGQVVACRFREQIPPVAHLKPDACYGSWELIYETAFEPAIVRALLELTAEGAEVRIEPLQSVPEQSHTASEPSTQQEPPNPSTETTSVAAVNANTAVATASASKGEAQSIRVSTEKIDALMNLVSEIVIAQSMLSSAQNADTDERTRAAIMQMERHVRDLHERVMAIRLLPVSYLFNRFPRMVRDTAAKLGKKVNFEIEGEETELDRTLLESLSDPLTHLIRNAIDHGIEPPEERRQQGKPETGTIKLSAFQSEGRIYIEVRDDGRGIDTERVRQKAIQLGWITENDFPPDETLYEFIFQPGFSTAQQVSDLSGRGVGMDVVKRNVESLGGSISVQSKRGEGTRFLLRVPLTLAIMDGLGLTVADEHYIVPLTAVVEAFQYESLQHTALFDRHEMVNVRGEFIPLVRLREFVGLPKGERDGLIVVLEQEGQQIALLIDGIAGQQQVVLKSLEENFTRVPGFAGATILGDGRVALILDVSDLIRRAHQVSERYAAIA
ncbi:MAG: chemotaxis protein CheA [Armatimonadetes bacterium JP3_11]|nr:MAG: chemotaxis protein CheA [Armatimonadetes bacterium CP1_7O]OYT75852.1 MAG: chemotaxis protein CheA [Armatimonadetes bacterium JP3_11]RMH08139.1 MAG: chemotaxis protein CheA [Armatimonadota bacterium]